MRALLLATAFLSAACNAQSEQASGSAAAQGAPASGRPFAVTEIADLSEPWAMTFLPNGDALITEKRGRLLLWRQARGSTKGGGATVTANANAFTPVAGTPRVDYGGQGGLGDVIIHPDFANNNFVYLSWAEAGSGDTRGGAVGRARLVRDGAAARIEGLQVIWRQSPKVTGRGHYGHRLAFSPDGRYLFITSGDRQKFDPAQDMNANLGKVIRVTDAGGIPSDNPFHGQGGAVRGGMWSLGHRNPLGIAFAPDGQLWTHEMGPKGGDEFNRIERGSNYGYPIVSNGDHYDGREIPDHNTQPRFNAPEISWTPVISPAGMIFYSGNLFPQWRGSALMGGLSGQALVRVEVNGAAAREAERWDMGARIREVEQGPDGAVYILEDEDDGSRGRLLRLTPAR